MERVGGFSSSYAEARAKFRDAAVTAGAEVDCFENPNRGPAGEVLATDVAWVGAGDAERVLVLISGVHGVEGYCGSGVQVDWLRSGEAGRLPDGTAVLLVHAANPHGFAWSRRVTEENVDLNRNWVDHGGALPDNPGYDELSESLLPREWNARSRAASAAVFGAYIASHGVRGFQDVVSRGQYGDPQGLFYGGREPTWARRTLSAILTGTLASARRVAIIDHHTGLGPWGLAEEMVSEPRGAPVFARAARWFGAAVATTAGGGALSADLTGDGMIGMPRLLPQAEVTAITLEFGVRPIEETFDALRADAWLHRYGAPESRKGQRIRARMLSTFHDSSAAWKGMVLGQSRAVIRRALAGLAPP